MSHRTENRVVAIMFFAWGTVFLDRMAQLYLMPYIAADLHLDATQIGLLASGMAVCWAISTLAFGALSDRVGRKVILVPLTVTFSLLSAASGFVKGFQQLLIARSLMGLAEGPCWSVMNALVDETSSPERRGRNVGIVVSAAALIGLGVAPILTTQIAAQFGWRAAFLIAAIPGLLLAFLIARLVPEPARREAVQADGASFWSLFRYRNTYLCSLAAAGFMSWLFLQNIFAPLYITRVEHQDARIAGLLLGAAGLGSFFIGIVGPWLSDKVGRRSVLIGMALLSSLLPAALLIHDLYAHIWLLALILFVTQGGQAITALAIVVIPAESVPVTLTGTAIGFVTLVGEILGGTISPVLGGALADAKGLEWPLILASASSLLVALAAVFMKKTHA